MERINERFALTEPTELRALLAPVGLAERVDLGEVLAIARLGHARREGDLFFCDRLPPKDLDLSEAAGIGLTTAALVDQLRASLPLAHLVAISEPRTVFIDVTRQLLANDRVEVSDAIPRPFGTHSSATIGERTIVHPETRIEADVEVGNHCILHRGVWLKQGAIIRDKTVLGCEGMDLLVGNDGNPRRFAHLAGVMIGKRAIIGVGSVIPRGILTSTRIGDDSVVGNLCNIGHGVVLEESVWVAAGSIIGGHTTIGRKATLGMSAVVKDNVTIGAEARVGMGSVVVRSVPQGTTVFGNPASNLRVRAQTGPVR